MNQLYKSGPYAVRVVVDDEWHDLPSPSMELERACQYSTARSQPPEWGSGASYAGRWLTAAMILADIERRDVDSDKPFVLRADDVSHFANACVKHWDAVWSLSRDQIVDRVMHNRSVRKGQR